MSPMIGRVSVDCCGAGDGDATADRRGEGKTMGDGLGVADAATDGEAERTTEGEGKAATDGPTGAECLPPSELQPAVMSVASAQRKIDARRISSPCAQNLRQSVACGRMRCRQSATVALFVTGRIPHTQPKGRSLWDRRAR
jgi:hypothetical protein